MAGGVAGALGVGKTMKLNTFSVIIPGNHLLLYHQVYTVKYNK